MKNREDVIERLRKMKSVVITSSQLKEFFPVDYGYGAEILEKYANPQKNRAFLAGYIDGTWSVKVTFEDKRVGFALAKTADVFTEFPKEGPWFDDTWTAFTDEELQGFENR